MSLRNSIEVNPFEEYPQIIENIKNEIENENRTLYKLKLIRAKDGVYVYRGKLDKQSVVIKYFEREEYKREIYNYRLLNDFNIPTMKVIAYGNSCIVLEDIDCSETWRLGIKEDLIDEDVAYSLAYWYFDFHEKGLLYDSLDKMYHETDVITVEKLKDLCIKLPEAYETFDYIIVHFDKLKKLSLRLTQTFNYNDFYWTNLLVSKDKSKAMPFDYNFLGAGFRYNDLKNVTSSLSKESGEVFLCEYNRLFEEKYGYSRNEEALIEKQIYSVTSVLISLIMAFERKDFPSWAISERDAVTKGEFLVNAKRLLG